MEPKSFGELLKKHRLDAGLTREELAERARLSVKTISALEQGSRQKPYRDTIGALADALELSPDARAKLESAAVRRTAPPSHKAQLLNLPGVVTPLVDRHDDVKAVLDLLAQYRLVTVTGSGGVGKTRVAVAAAERYAEQKLNDVAFVDLSPLLDGSFIAGTAAAVFGARGGDSSDAGALIQYLRNRTLLLILDNCEHLIDSAADLATTILQACSGVSILATSRERLDLPGEALFRLPSLAFPNDETATAAGVDSYGAIKLFVERAKAVDSRFGVTDGNVNVIADICRRLEGIPLAIELAAAQLPAFGLTALRECINERFMPARGVPSRHATMHATIAWSYELLAQGERALLNGLGIFVDGFTLDAAHQVCGAEPQILASLVDKSLVDVSFEVDVARYRLLDSVRHYAVEQLALADESDASARRHAEWVLELARQAERLRQSGAVGFAPFAIELGNIRGALQWALESTREDDAVTGGRIAGGLRGLWLRTGRQNECRCWMQSFIEKIDEERYPDVAAKLWAGLVQATFDAVEGPAAIEHAIPLFERIGDYERVVHLRVHLARFRANRGMYPQAETDLVEALRVGAAHHLEGSSAYVHALGALAGVVSAQQRFDGARAYIEEAFHLLPPEDRAWRRWIMTSQADVEFEAGNTMKALQICEDACRRFPHRGVDLAYLYTSMSAYQLLLNDLDAAELFASKVVNGFQEDQDAAIAAIEELAAAGALRGELVTPAKLLGYVNEWNDRNEYRRSSLRQSIYELAARALRECLSEETLEQLISEGRALTFYQAIDAALEIVKAKHSPEEASVPQS